MNKKTTLSERLAQKQVQNFEQKFTKNKKIVHLAYHAAVPVVLTPKLLHLIRINCPDLKPLPPTAESDLLQSSLCQQIDNNHYKIKKEIRDILLERLSKIYGEERFRLIGSLLWEYTKQESLWKDNLRLYWAQLIIASTAIDPVKGYKLFDHAKKNHVQSDDWCAAVQQEISCITKIFQNKELHGISTPPPPPLKIFEFEVITINESGEIEDRWLDWAMYYEEDLDHDVKLQMVWIPGGVFQMGAPEKEKGSYASEYPQHEVTIAPFYMSKYPITQEQWKTVAALPKIDHPLVPDPSCFRGERQPVESVLWQDVKEFLKRLRKHTNRAYRLPTEAEWEYACRAGTNTPFYFGETITPDLANYQNEATTEVDKFPPNAFGLYDMHGNVWEWCSDEWHENYDKGAFSKPGSHVLRGGSWFHPQKDLRCACRRLRRIPRIEQRGFRLACSVR